MKSNDNMDKKPENIHKEHRQRVKKRFMNEGLDRFEPHNVLEFILFFCIPQGDTNVLAHRLIDEFGTFSKVLDANFHDLCNVKGVGEHTAMLLKMLPQAARYYLTDIEKQTIILNTSKKIGDFIRPHFFGRTVETVFLLCLDGKYGVVFNDILHEGGIDFVEFQIREIIEIAISRKAVGVIIAHNHPHGLALPSSEDITITKALKRGLDTAGINFVDHFIFADNDYTSLKESGYF